MQDTLRPIKEFLVEFLADNMDDIAAAIQDLAPYLKLTLEETVQVLKFILAATNLDFDAMATAVQAALERWWKGTEGNKQEPKDLLASLLLGVPLG